MKADSTEQWNKTIDSVAPLASMTNGSMSDCRLSVARQVAMDPANWVTNVKYDNSLCILDAKKRSGRKKANKTCDNEQVLCAHL